MGFSQALSGLNAAASSLDVQGNNIANSQTVGFKSSSAQFADVFANSKVGLGTRMSTVLQDFGEGNLESTGRALDLGISGEGFFRFSQNDQVVYSRNGQLSMTADGFLQNAQGARIMGFGAVEGEVQTGGQPGILQIGTEELEANATNNVSTVMNLDSREKVGDGLSQTEVVTDVSAPDVAANQTAIDYHFSNNFTVYDSLGNARSVAVYYEKSQKVTGAPVGDAPIGSEEFVNTGGDTYYRDPDTDTYYDDKGESLASAPSGLEPVPEPNAWDAQVTLDGYYNSSNDFQVTFDKNGLLSQVDGADAGDIANMPSLTFVNNQTTPLGEDPQALQFSLNLTGSTQFGNTARTTDLQQDGYTSGAFVGISIEGDGTIMSNFSNEQSRAVGQIAMANFRNPEGLHPEGDNAWSATMASGQELVGAPGSGLLGSIESGAIEASNVDMARELVDMIVTQRAYQANSQTIKTQDEVLQTAINLR